MHGNNLELWRRHGLPLIGDGDAVLEVGPEYPGGGVCRPMVVGRGALYHFADLKNSVPQVPGFIRMGGEYEIESDDNRFDVVFSLSVAEHVRKLWTWARELVRITRPGGHVIFVNPLSWPYHESPVDAWRIFPEGWKAIFEECGLEHEFSWHGNVAPLEDFWRQEHGPGVVTDCIAVGRKTK